MFSLHSPTPISLLEGLRSPSNVEAWQEFSKRYGKLLRQWCRKWGLQDADAEDLVQETILIVMSQISVFRHQGIGSFRSWMKTIAWRCWCRAIARAEKDRNISLPGTNYLSSNAYDDLLSSFNSLASRELLQISMELARERVETHTWDAFKLTVLDEISGAEAATRLGMSIGSVYMARCRVQRFVAEELKKLDPDM